MKIFIGPHEIAGYIPMLAQGFRECGHEVTTAVRVNYTYKYAPDTHYDMRVDPTDIAQVSRIIEEYDVFVFLYGISLLYDNADFPLIRRAGKKILFLCCGSDVRYWPATSAWLGVDYEKVFEEAVPEVWRPESLRTVLATLRRAELFADVIVGTPFALGLALRPYRHFFSPIPLHRLPYSPQSRDVPVVVHAPSNKSLKGTKLFLQVLDELKAEGVQFELQLLHGVDNRTVIAHLQNADCAIDQLLSSGTFTYEAMACGCAVASGNWPEHMPWCRALPVWDLQSHPVKEQLRRFLTDKTLRMELVEAGRAHVERFHSPQFVTRQFLDALAQGSAFEGDYHPSYYADTFELPAGITVPPVCHAMTTRIVQRHGLPIQAGVASMVQRGLLDAALLHAPVRRWEKTAPDMQQYLSMAVPLPAALTELRAQPGGGAPQQAVFHSACAAPDPLVAHLVAMKKGLDFKSLFLQRGASAALRDVAMHLEFGVHVSCVYSLDDALAKTRDASLVPALGLLLWGQGSYELAAQVLQHVTEQTYQREVVWLAQWLRGVYHARCNALKQAMPLLANCISLHRKNGQACVRLVDAVTPPDGREVVSWQPPQGDGAQRGWASPAALLPDWVDGRHNLAVWSCLAALCLQQGVDWTYTGDEAAMVLVQDIKDRLRR